MNRYIIILLAIICFSNLSANDDIQALTDSASNYYINADYENALRIYNSIYEQNYSSADLYYNIGNCYYKIGDIANCIYFYEKAHALQPNNKDIEHNLKIANANIKNKVEIIPEVFYISWYNNIMTIMSSDSWSIASVIFFIISLLLIGIFLFSKSIYLRKLGFIVGIICFCTSIISLILSDNQAKDISKNKHLIVFESTIIKSSPSDDSINLFEVNEGLKLEMLDSLNEWINIRLPDGKEGWIHKNNVKKL